MPRRRPTDVRASFPLHRTQASRPAIDGVSSRALSEVARLERTRNYLQPGDVTVAVRLWRDYVRRSKRQQWHDYEWGNVHWYCCGNPLEARALLDKVMNAMSLRGARELRKIINRLDAAYSIPLSPHDGKGG
ncbi:hypothetical protein [Kitasatospora mediocidica]|uniref:hypothetical protein n=1 Tax=Kitasatospora mediocidica TaxID=58352 RepID=UPI00068F3340|nr:hypothetical protein [Kitasatospora mediocidica]